MKTEETGFVKYGARAFHQDATEAMQGDIVRALIEAITNADDAYGDKDGKIRIEVEHRRGPWRVVVRDKAKGMRALRMKEAIAHLGSRTSGFEVGEDVRGNLGRGAKDLAAFGTVTFESICENKYARLTLEPTGEYKLSNERSVLSDDRDKLSIPKGSGTVVTIQVSDNIRCPQHRKLTERLRKHFQLRDILADPRRQVLLVDLNGGEPVTLHSSPATLPVLFDQELQIPGYPEASAKVQLFRNPERYDEPASDPGRPGGLLIRGRRAIYQNTYFRFENNPYAGWFSGRVECRYVDKLASEYDERLEGRQSQDERNPQPIITRRRDGLQASHPFFKALAQAVEGPLGELIAGEERRAKESKSHESARMRRALDTLGRDLARLVDEDLKEIEEEGLAGGDSGDASAPPIRLIPEQVVLYMGEDKTVTVQVRADLGIRAVEALLEPGGVVELLDAALIDLAPHRRRADVLTGQIRVRPLLEDAETLLTARGVSSEAVALIEVRGEREVVEVPISPPEGLQFERDSYRLAWTKRKTLRVIAPVEVVASHGGALQITSSDAGVVVLGQRVELKLDDAVEYYCGEVQVEGRTLGAKATLNVRLADLVTSCNVAVGRNEESPSLQIKVVDEEAGNNRAIVERSSGQTVIKIMGRHPALKRYRGAAPAFPGDQLIATNCQIAEIVAGEAARVVMERKFPLGGAGEQLDAARLYVEHNRYLTKYLARCHRELVPEASLE